ncbi:CFF_collapsed_G0053010.mRNA.1.CDS.1 [Saccharomyces cerevisiae]|nr:Dse3p [Saccharomyces cerevisiae YJM1417]CAI5323163.1 CFF_HP2_G0045820.mRNA.1.CDS.1 [Saccharomyces cerevisiae]CAI6741789.1 CFF_HP2_G0045820.mRNA.1.CDS.1 [Saccharomyces cerevisiae]CAI6759580.1 CFF_HP1_G0048030.mRNA.1.CDS.1 [Saccharomyces cerevisiae]CAI7472984.1 CFF_collapsed_G0053010.mRNA.1.CDS.1 [Saccharomyces cerevisiae]
MPRKFLGNKIEKNVDAVRPSSLTLTADDLKYIPPIPQDFEDEDDKVLRTSNVGNRLSKRFGGTLKLKKRLESVPELFLHDFKKRPRSQLEVIREKKFTDMQVPKGPVCPQSTILPLRERKKVKSLPIQRKSLRRPTLSKPAVVQSSGHKTHSDHIIDKVFVSRPAPIVMPVKALTPINPVSLIQTQTQDCCRKNKYGKSGSEILFDEILSAYENVSTSNSTALNSEIDRIIDICASKQIAKKNEAFQVPYVVCPDDTETLFSSTTPKLKPVNSNTLNDVISSPEYTTSGCSTYSDQSNSDEELSEVESIVWNTNKRTMRSSIVSESTSEEGYCTAAETLPSTVSVEDLDIHNKLPKVAQTSSCNTLLNKLSIRKLKKVILDPPKIMHVMTFDDDSDDGDDNDDEDRALNILQKKIDCIEIASCSSSIYSE